MAATLAEAAARFADLAKNLRAVGEGELRRELYKAISDAVKPVADEIKSTAHLDPYLPDRYAAVLSAGLSVRTFKRTGADAGVTIVATAPTVGRGGRKVRRINDGVLGHPLFGDRERWFQQTRSVRPGFFTDPCEAAAPRVRDAITAAVDQVERKAVGR